MINRYELFVMHGVLNSEEEMDGEWCHSHDVSELEAEVQELKCVIRGRDTLIDILNQKNDKLTIENAGLKGEVSGLESLMELLASAKRALR